MTAEPMTDASPSETVAAPPSVPERRVLGLDRREGIALLVLCVIVVVLARTLHRHGHSWGDDFALYIDQARSLYRGETRSVIEDNRFAVMNSATPTFSPYGYPWVWPMVLSPFVAVFGLDYDSLKWVSVAMFVLVLIGVHRLVRHRASGAVALGVVAVVGLSPHLLGHTDKLLSEYPYMVAVLAALLVLDRVAVNGAARWSDATTRQLVMLGLLVMVAFNIRREGMGLAVAIAASQLVGRAPWRRIWIPHVTFAVSGVVFQLLLPTAFLPRYPGDGFHHAKDMLAGPLPRAITAHLSLGEDGFGLAGWILVLALVGGLLRMIRHARTDVALLVFPLCSLVAFARFPFNGDPRYYIQVLPFALYFLARLPETLAELGWPRSSVRTSRTAVGIGVAALAVLALVQVWHLPAPLREARAFADAGKVQFGPADPTVRAVLDAVEQNTPPDAVVAFMKARTMTLYTDRRAIQSSDLGVVLRNADYLAMLRGSDFSQPLITDEIAAQYGMTIAWENPTWILWQVP